MPTPLGRALPLIIIGGAAAVAVGVTAIIDRLTVSRETLPAAPGTPQLSSRLPLSLWPSDGTEPLVERGLPGWRRMLDALHHRDTVVDQAARARAVVFAEYPRREQDARREIALEAHVLRGTYEPALIAAAWLHPLRGISLEDLTAFGIGDTANATVSAAAHLDAHPDIVTVWRRELGIDVVDPRVTEQIIADTPADRRGMLWAVLLDLATERVLTRQLQS